MARLLMDATLGDHRYGKRSSAECEYMNATQTLVSMLPLFAILSGCAMFDPAARGRRDAAGDISAGRRVLKLVHGRPAPWRKDFTEILKTDYGIESELVINDREYVAAYNDTMKPEFERIFGANVIDIANDKALATYESEPGSETPTHNDTDEP